MGYTIAIAGKGGTGKTTVASLIVRLIKEKNLGSVLAIDADPNSNLAEALGIEPGETIGSILDEICQHPEKIPSGMSKDRYIEYRIQTSIQEGGGFDVLTMGRPEGPGCYCYVNNVLRNIMSKLIKDYAYVIIDNEAGLEHLSRRTTRLADVLLVISDPSKPALRAARKIYELAGELKIDIKHNFLIVNRFAKGIDEEQFLYPGLDYIGSIPQDEEIEKISLNSGSLMKLGADAASMKALRALGEKIWQKNRS